MPLAYLVPRMEMRNKAKAGKPAKGDGIVRRELASVLTNGTVVDEAFLTEEEASHCVAIKEGRSEDGLRATYGVCVLDAATGQFELSSWEDDNVATRLETLTRQLRIKELLHEKVGLGPQNQVIHSYIS
jgi:DNA mismatch repair protein MSH6